ncbi:MAG: hypothetical protein OEZ68_20885 [Gammaproteobacteria bacterium]|nr:hypothetical protein [Gammaproteobacteria bacterium]MDH5803258.1 hypothetical protein [Gammaproteobacteria bacterium]
MNLLKLIFVGLFAITLSACGGGGSGEPTGLQYTGVTTGAGIDENNAQALAISAQEGVDAQVSAENVPLGAVSADNGLMQAMMNQVNSIISNQQTSGTELPAGITQRTNGDCPSNPGYMELRGTQTSGTINFYNYCVVNTLGNMVFNGYISYMVNEPIVTVEMVNLSVSYAGYYMALNATMTINNTTGDVSMTVRWVGVDGKVHQIVGFSILGSGTDLSPFSVSGRVYHADHGYVDIATPQGLVYDTTCAGPLSGIMTITGGDGSMATITYDCNSYTVEVSGGTGAVIHNW